MNRAPMMQLLFLVGQLFCGKGGDWWLFESGHPQAAPALASAGVLLRRQAMLRPVMMVVVSETS